MALIWTDTLATGIRQIDLQHQELLELINMLEEAHEAGRHQEALDDLLPKLNAYVLFHFGTEEALLSNLPASHAEAHRLQHREFTDQVALMRSEAQDAIDVAALIAYLKRWLVEHIMKTDRDMARQVLALGTLSLP